MVAEDKQPAIFNKGEARRVQTVVEHVEATMPILKARRVQKGGRRDFKMRDAQLTASLSVATNSKTGATTAAAKFLIPDPDNAGDLKDGDAFTVTNRSLDASGVSGDYMVVARVAGEWRLIWIDC